jgi:integral membrane sensor domain MASE1
LVGQEALPIGALPRPDARIAMTLWGGRPLLRDLTAMSVTGLAYYAGARIGLLPALVRGQVTPFWPPTGIAVVCLLVFGLRSLPGVAIAAFAVNAPLGPTLPAALGIATGNTLAPLAAVFAIRLLKVSLELGRLRDSLLFVVIALASMTISASVGTTMLRVSGGVRTAQIWSTWSVWWAGDAMGVLVVAPVLLHLRRMWPWRIVRPALFVEFVALLVLVTTVTVYAITSGSPAGLLICPLLVWSALRFRQLGAALVALEVAVLGSAAAAGNHGAFARGTVSHSMLVLQLFNASIALTGLLLAAAITQLDDSRRDLAFAGLLLSQRVEQRDTELDRDRRRMAVLTDRYRIATQLHDTVLQRLFGVGTALEAAVGTFGPDHRQSLARVVAALDTTINDLAVAIYQVEDDNPDATFTDAIDHVIAASLHPLGLRPERLALTGDGELVPLALRPQLLAALHDGLNDLGDRPGTQRVSVAMAVEGDAIELLITAEHDPGRYVESSVDGIQRAAARVRRLGGSGEWRSAADRSVLTLRIPTG